MTELPVRDSVRSRKVLAVAEGDPFAPATWSGTPHNVCTALRALDLDVVGADPTFGRLESPLNLLAGVPHVRSVRSAFGTISRRSITDAGAMSDRYRRARTQMIARRAREHQTRSAVIFSHSGVSIPSSIDDVVLVEDITIAQVGRLQGHFRSWDGFSREYVDRRAAAQAAQQRSAGLVAFLSQWAADAALSDYGLEPDRVAVIGVGSRFEPFVGKRDWSTPRFLFVGMDWERKNGTLVIEGFRTLRQDYPTAELHLVGNHPGVNEPGIIDHGPLPQSNPDAVGKLRGLYRTSTCFVMPSSLEPSALSYAEAASQGLPSIGTTHGGSAGIFGRGGIAVDPNARGVVTSAMARMADPLRAAEIGREASLRAPLLTWQAVAKRLAAAAGWWKGEVPPL